MAKKNSEAKVIEFKNTTKKKWKPGRSGLILLAVIVIAVAYFAVSALKIVQLNAEKEEALARHEELLRIKEDLTAEYENISSAQYIERLARRDLKLVKSNELLFLLPERGLGSADETGADEGTADAEAETDADAEKAEGNDGEEDGKTEN